MTNASLRGVVKANVDFLCGVAAVLIALTADHLAVNVGVVRTGILACVVGAIAAGGNWIGSGGYRSIWRFTGVREALLLAATSFAVFLALVAVRLSGAIVLAVSTILLIPLLVHLLTGGARTIRRWQVSLAKRRARANSRPPARTIVPRRVLIVGAGETGFLVSQEILQTGVRSVEIVGFVDDDPSTIGTRLNGFPILGPISQMLEIAEHRDVTELVVAMPSAPPERVRAIVRRAEDVGLRARIIPGFERLVTSGDSRRPGVITLQDLTNEPAVNRNGIHSASEKSRVLVTGGAGYIGSHLTRMLLERGYNVRVLENFAYGDAGLRAVAEHPRLEVVRGDICSVRDVGRAMRDVDCVLALAAIVGDPACNLDPEETINLNYASTKTLAEAADFYGVKRLVFASSCSVYGASANGTPLLSERSRLNPVSLYARTRVLSENIVFDRCGDVEPVVLRLATVFGLSPRMRFDLVVNTLTARAVVDGKISIFGGNQWRPNVHCRDVARAFVLAAEAPSTAVAGEIFNVGGEQNNHRISEIGSMVAEVVRDVEVVFQNDVPDPRDYRVSFEKIRRTLGFVPAFSVRDGILEVAEAMRSDQSLRAHTHPIFHNVHALRQAMGAARDAVAHTAERVIVPVAPGVAAVAS